MTNLRDCIPEPIQYDKERTKEEIIDLWKEFMRKYKLCPNCEAEIGDLNTNIIFCPYCGSEL